jgi:Spy/CpxP family protein refolding chaperone
LDAEYTPKLQAIVGADAVKRLKQIQIQAQGADAITSAAVAAELKLTDEQKKKLADLNTEYQTKQRELFTAGGDQQERAAKQRELRTEQTTKATAVLTAEQKEKFTALKGKAFDVSTLRFGGGRRGGNNN